MAPAQDNIHESVPANHNHPFSSASAAAPAANHINPHLHPAMSHNNMNIAHHTYPPQAHGSFPTSYNDFFAGHDWRQPAQTANGAAVTQSRPQSTASPAPASALPHQPWENQTVYQMSLPTHSPEQQHQNAMSMSAGSAYGSFNHSVNHQQDLPPYNVPGSRPAVPMKTQQNVATQQPGTTYPSSAQSKSESVLYVPYSTPQQFQSQPTYGHGNLYPGYGIQYPQIHNEAQSTPSPATPPITTSSQPVRMPQILKQLHEALPDVPSAEKLKANPQFSAIDVKQLCAKTNSKLVNPLLAVSQDAVELSHSKVAQLPRFEARKNLHELRQTVGQDADLKLRIEKLDKKVRSKVASIVSSTQPPSSGSPVVKAPSPSSSEEEESETSVESEDDLEIEEKIPIPASRPTDPFKGAEYDVIKAVWHSRSTYLENEILLQRISQFSDLFSKLRDRWKVSNDALKDAEQKKATGQISSLTNKVNQNRKIVEVALKAAVMHGHPHILTMLSENKRLIAGMYGLLSDRINKKSYDDTLSVSTLQFLDRLSNITTETLDTTKLSKALPYFVKRGAETSKILAKKVIDRAAENTKKEAKASAAAPTIVSEAASVSSASAAKVDKAIASAVEKPVASNTLKRPRVLDAPSGQPTKKQAVSAATTKITPTSAANVAKRPVTTIGSKSSATASATNAKPKIAVKPATPAVVAKKAIPTVTKAASTTRPTETSKSGFSFGGMMQNILKPAVVEVKEVSEEPVPAETEEEKAKRLKKEKRRALRVSWKPDHDLCAIKIFTHDPEEETGHNASSVRDVNDVGNEGRMFKQLHKDHKEIVDVELEEEEKEESFTGEDWQIPALIDFSDLDDPDVEWNKIFTPFGRGERQPDSADRDLQKSREAATLMAVYITREDIPSRPQSPTEPLQEAELPATAFGSPDDRTKQREQAIKAPINVDMDAIARILGGTNSDQAAPVASIKPAPSILPPSAPAPAPAQFNQQDLLAALQSLSNPVPPPATSSAAVLTPAISAPVTSSNQPAMNPMALAGLFSNIPFPPPPPPSQPIPPSSNTSHAPPPIDFNALLAHFQNQNGQATQTPVVPPPMPPAAGAPPVPNVADLWAQLGLTQSGQPPAPASFGAFNADGTPTPAAQQPDNNQYIGQYEHPDRKRYRDIGDDDFNNDQWNKRPNSGMSNTRGGTAKNWDSQRKPKWSYEDNSKKFTLPCKFWPLGKCTKGANCTYRHDM